MSASVGNLIPRKRVKIMQLSSCHLSVVVMDRVRKVTSFLKKRKIMTILLIVRQILPFHCALSSPLRLT